MIARTIKNFLSWLSNLSNLSKRIISFSVKTFDRIKPGLIYLFVINVKFSLNVVYYCVATTVGYAFTMFAFIYGVLAFALQMQRAVWARYTPQPVALSLLCLLCNEFSNRSSPSFHESSDPRLPI